MQRAWGRVREAYTRGRAGGWVRSGAACQGQAQGLRPAQPSPQHSTIRDGSPVPPLPFTLGTPQKSLPRPERHFPALPHGLSVTAPRGLKEAAHGDSPWPLGPGLRARASGWQHQGVWPWDRRPLLGWGGSTGATAVEARETRPHGSSGEPGVRAGDSRVGTRPHGHLLPAVPDRGILGKAARDTGCSVICPFAQAALSPAEAASLGLCGSRALPAAPPGPAGPPGQGRGHQRPGAG